MVEEPKRTIAYLCPSCRQSVVVEKTVFSLAAAPSAIPCPCGKSALKTEIIGDRVKLTGSLVCSVRRSTPFPVPRTLFSMRKHWLSPAQPRDWTAAMWEKRGRFLRR